MKKPRGRGKKNSPSDVHIPHEIVEQVLVRLPSRSLMRFKCVCRLWKSTICDPQFVLSHRARFNGNLFVTFWQQSDKIVVSSEYIDKGEKRGNDYPTIVLNLKRDHYDPSCVHVSRPLDGLVCVYSEVSNHAFVLNITTGQIVHLPRCIPPCRKSLYRKGKRKPFGFPIKKDFQTFYALGFDSATSEYKVLNMYSHTRRRDVICEIYTLGTPSRRKIEVPSSCVAYPGSPSACINGIIYWLRDLDEDEDEPSTILIAFDVSKEVFRAIGKIQLEPYEYTHPRKLFAIGEQLVIGSFSFGHQFNLVFLEVCGDNSCTNNNNGDVKMETIAFQPILKNTFGVHASGVRPTSGAIVVIDYVAKSRIVYLDFDKRTYREEVHLKWSHPNGDESLMMGKSQRYIYAENIITLREDHSCLPDADDNFLIEGS